MIRICWALVYCWQIVANIDHEDLHNLAEMLSQIVRAGYSSCWASINYLYPVALQIDFDSSQQDNRVCIQSGVDETIDELSQLIEGQSGVCLRTIY